MNLLCSANVGSFLENVFCESYLNSFLDLLDILGVISEQFPGPAQHSGSHVGTASWACWEFCESCLDSFLDLLGILSFVCEEFSKSLQPLIQEYNCPFIKHWPPPKLTAWIKLNDANLSLNFDGYIIERKCAIARSLVCLSRQMAS